MKKKEFKGKLNLNKIKISKLEAKTIRGGEMPCLTAGEAYSCGGGCITRYMCG